MIAHVIAALTLLAVPPAPGQPTGGTVSSAPAVVSIQAAARDRRGPDCTAVFNTNKTRIEGLAAAGRTDDIKAIFTAAGCPQPTVEAPPAAGPTRQMNRITCEATLVPPRIRCTFMARSQTPDAS
ncbi:hypothetical protein [Brevundimonas sp.]|uniref:hypothetical protein n=1 Tax=Brevundimonas sp. TaxID=1871086 RepID=UPI0027308CF6|nr:hypothetical protein [Brevundimonas sp.]MDP1914246.1 hypothetical protein [Brevundimonas sp.]